MKKVPKSIFAITSVVLASMLIIAFFTACENPASEAPALTAAVAPDITLQPVGASYELGAGSAAPLIVTAISGDGGTLSYQWYRNTTNEAIIDSDHQIPDAASDTCIPDISEAGETWYYVEVTNTRQGASPQSARVVSETAKITVTVPDPAAAATPVVDLQPLSATVTQGDTITLNANASAGDSGFLSYQWYKNTENNADLEDSKKITVNGTGAAYQPDTGAVGASYYYVVVTNSGPEGAGKTPVSVTSAVAAVTVQAAAPNQSSAIEFSSQPVSASYTRGDTPAALTLTANAAGTLSYQWYRSTVSASPSDVFAGGNALGGQTTNSHTPDTGVAGVFYYGVKVTHTESGKTPREATSSIATITVTTVKAPVITAHPQGAAYTADAASPAALSVTLETWNGADGTLSYQWYKNSVNDTGSGSTIGSATNSTYTPPVNTAGITYYYVKVTNTKNSDTAVVTSNVAAIRVNNKAPSITAQPVDASYDVDDESVTPLSVTVAATTDGGQISYQWYKNAVDNNTAGSAINEATSSTYAPLVNEAGILYYYVVVTNSTPGVTPAVAASDTAEITVQVPMVTVTFNVGDAVGGPLPASVPQGGQLTAPGTDGLTNGTLTFGGWFTDSTLRYPVEFPLTVTGDMTVYAKWDHENVLVIWPNKSWNMMGQNVQLQAGVTYTLGAEYKLGKAGAYYGRLAFSVRYYSGSALVSMPLITFTEGGPLAWTRAETTFVAPVSGWYTIRIPDPGAWAPDAPDQVAVEAYVNRTWLYAANSTENKLGDADFAKSTSIWSTANNSPDRFLDSNTTSCWPWYTNNPPAWVKSEWEDSGGSGGYWQPSCLGYWGGASAASFAIQQNPNAKNQ